ncbi:MAG TPA: hypothetical protein VEG44_04105 [Candidatus Acidoferrales bacterium]|nr:hypothetical protein [Candidatus Acidoferrales bacterium]
MRIIQGGEDEKRREDESSRRPLQSAIILTAILDTTPKMSKSMSITTNPIGRLQRELMALVHKEVELDTSDSRMIVLVVHRYAIEALMSRRTMKAVTLTSKRHPTSLTELCTRDTGVPHCIALIFLEFRFQPKFLFFM